MTILDLEDLQPTEVLPVERAVNRFGRTILICPNTECTRLSGHFGDCDKHRGRHRPNRIRGPVTPSDAHQQLPASLDRSQDSPDWIDINTRDRR